MGIKNIIQKFLNKRSELKRIGEDEHYRELLAEKKKTANERELERYMEEQRQENITRELGRFRQVKQQENNRNRFANNEFMFGGTPSIMQNNKNLFALKGNLL